MDNYLWMSFAADDGFRGVIISDNTDLKYSMKKAWELGINPGGQIKAYEMPSNEVKSDHIWMLMSKDDLKRYGYID